MPNFIFIICLLSLSFLCLVEFLVQYQLMHSTLLHYIISFITLDNGIYIIILSNLWFKFINVDNMIDFWFFEQDTMLVPPWLKPLLNTPFFNVCRIHGDAARSECNMFCLDCNVDAFCFYCRSSRHKDHQVIQVY
jgi:hypothetical protein